MLDLLEGDDKEALSIQFGAQRLSAEDLHDRSLRLAAGLRALGVSEGSTVAILLGNGPQFVIAWFAVTSLGAVALPLNPAYGPAELEFYLSRARASVAIATGSALNLCRQVRETLRTGLTLVGDAHADHELASLENAQPSPLPPRQADEVAVLLHSSGVTGRPKLIPRTHGQLRAEMESFSAVTRLDSQDVIFCAVPLFHAHGLGNCLLAALRAGARLVIAEHLQPLQVWIGELLTTMTRERITVLPGTPLLFDFLVNDPAAGDLSAVRLCFSAGAPLGRDTFARFWSKFGIPVRQLYGCSEAGALFLNLDADVAPSADSVGHPLANVEARLEAERGLEAELLIRAPSLTSGYLDQPEENREAFRDGWFRTGDLGHLDDAGRLRLTGRKRVYITVGGQKVDPYEVEEVLVQLPGVREALVVSVDGPNHTQILKAVIVASAAIDPAQVQRFCRTRLAAWKAPEMVEFRDALPRSPLGKILRKELL